MKKIVALTAFMLCLVGSPVCAQRLPSAESILQRVARKLAATKQLGYKYHFEFTERGEPDKFEERARAFLDIQPPDGTSRFRFQFDTAEKITIYNGIERFILDKKQKQMSVQSKPSFPPYGDILLHNSPLALKNALPKIAADRSISKKLSLTQWEGRDVYLIEFLLPKQIINLEGEVVEAKPPASQSYKIRVDKATLLPVEVVHAVDTDAAVFKTTYSDVTDRPSIPAASSWFFSSYQNEYALKKKNPLVLIEPAKTAPEFSLTAFETAEKISLAQYKGKLVLLDFWIINCGYCFMSVPTLNELYKKYHDRGLEMVSINMYDPAPAIAAYKKKSKPEFTVLTGGDSIAAAYGVDAYPAIVLIGESGNVLYSSKGLDEKDLEAAIAANLKPLAKVP